MSLTTNKTEMFEIIKEQVNVLDKIYKKKLQFLLNLISKIHLDIQIKLRWCEFNNKLPQTANRGSFLELDKEKKQTKAKYLKVLNISLLGMWPSTKII